MEKIDEDLLLEHGEGEEEEILRVSVKEIKVGPICYPKKASTFRERSFPPIVYFLRLFTFSSFLSFPF